jgi:hypothetical protein
VFRVHAAEWLEMPSAQAATMIANEVNLVLRVGKIVVDNCKLGIFAQEFIQKNGISSEVNLKRLIDDVLIGGALIGEHLNRLKKESNLSSELPGCPAPSLN